MRTATIAREGGLTDDMFPDSADKLSAEIGASPDLVLVAYTCHHDPDDVRAAAVASFPKASILGSSTCRGFMTDKGLFGFDAPAIGLFAISDPAGSYGVAYGRIDDEESPEDCAERLVARAQQDADRLGEVPTLVWLHASPGMEERVIAAVQNVLGREVLISGGSSADEDIAGDWSGFCNSASGGNGVGLALFYTDKEVTHHFESGYIPTEKSGIATDTKGRCVATIDGRPAAKVYDEWTDGMITPALSDTDISILGPSAWAPLGKVSGQVISEGEAVIDYYCLVHPSSVGANGELFLFADVAPGERLTMMSGSKDSLIRRSASVAASSLARSCASGGEQAGALMVFCAGCMLALGDDIRIAQEKVSAAYGATPFLGLFTFGEQGSFLNGERQHGNLMISSSVFPT